MVYADPSYANTLNWFWSSQFI